MKTRNLASILIAVIIGCALLTGCEDDDSSSGDAQGTTNTTQNAWDSYLGTWSGSGTVDGIARNIRAAVASEGQVTVTMVNMGISSEFSWNAERRFTWFSSALHTNHNVQFYNPSYVTYWAESSSNGFQLIKQ